MAAQLQLEITTPEKMVLNQKVDTVSVPASTGVIGILPGHAPVISELGAGSLSFQAEGKNTSIAVCGGYLEVSRDHVRILANSAELPSDIDVSRAEASLKRAAEHLSKTASGAVDVGRALNAMKRATARLEVARGQR
jgi:F-type H+-transporting ATPase subunit epsilon